MVYRTPTWGIFPLAGAKSSGFEKTDDVRGLARAFGSKVQRWGQPSKKREPNFGSLSFLLKAFAAA